MSPEPRTACSPFLRTSVLTRVAVIAIALILASCASRRPAPVEDRSTRPPPPQPPAAATPAAPAPPAEAPGPTYTVKRGDTLYAIALDHGLDYRELAAWNNLENINVIRTGQVLRLSPPGPPTGETSATGVTTTPLKVVPPVDTGEARAAPAPGAQPAPLPHGPASGRNTDVLKVAPRALKEPYTEQAWREAQRAAPAGPVASAVAPEAPAPAPTPAPRVEPAREAPATAAAPSEDDAKLGWVWPATGKLVTGFSDTANLKGIDIAGKEGQPILASAAGKVVYAGTGLRGYGKLVIIKHNATYLSAYAHNRDIVVKEGQQVAKGQKIAEMGNTDSDQVKLHFEIRRQGKPVDPLKYLPPA
jgi:lipoprotein NlpD